jgi:arsenate reductase
LLHADGAFMSDPVYNVLFLCTANSSRSVLAEAILNKVGKGKFRAYSAGSQPRGAINPFALALLTRLNHPTAGLRSKSWHEFTEPGAPEFDFIFTVCDDAAGEVCPVWPGKPATAHWGLADPAAVEGTDKEKAAAFAETFRMLSRRIETFAALPITSIDRLALQSKLREIGGMEGATRKAKAET